MQLTKYEQIILQEREIDSIKSNIEKRIANETEKLKIEQQKLDTLLLNISDEDKLELERMKSNQKERVNSPSFDSFRRGEMAVQGFVEGLEGC